MVRQRPPEGAVFVTIKKERGVGTVHMDTVTELLAPVDAMDMNELENRLNEGGFIGFRPVESTFIDRGGTCGLILLNCRYIVEVCF